MKRERWADLVDQLKAKHEEKAGPLNAVQNQAPLRDLAAYWPHCPREEHVTRYRGTDPWGAVSVDVDELAEVLCTSWHTALRLLRRAQDMGVIYPDGTVQNNVQRHLNEESLYSVVPPLVPRV